MSTINVKSTAIGTATGVGPASTGGSPALSDKFSRHLGLQPDLHMRITEPEAAEQSQEGDEQASAAAAEAQAANTPERAFMLYGSFIRA